MYEMKLHVVFCFVFIICLLLCVIYTMVVTEHIYTASSESLGSAICMGGCQETGKGVNFKQSINARLFKTQLVPLSAFIGSK